MTLEQDRSALRREVAEAIRTQLDTIGVRMKPKTELALADAAIAIVLSKAASVGNDLCAAAILALAEPGETV